MTYMSREIFEKHLSIMRSADELTVDTEGTLTHPYAETWGFSYSVGGVNEYFGFSHMNGTNLPKAWLPDAAKVLSEVPSITMHHAKHDLRSLKKLGVDRKGKPFKCIMVRAHMINENRYDKSLEAISKSYGGEPKKMPAAMKTIIDTPGWGWPFVPRELFQGYASNDAVITEEAAYHQQKEWDLEDFPPDLWNWEMRWIETLAAIEDPGVAINEGLAAFEYNRGTKIMREISKDLGFNPGSPIQLGHFLLDELGLPILKRTDSGNPSFDKKTMEKYDALLSVRNDKRAVQILIYKGWAKCTGSSYKPYLEKRSPVDGQFRTSYNMHRAKTGRLTAEYLHQIPRLASNDWNANTKKCITTVEEFEAWEFDYSQLEFRLAALYALAVDKRTQFLIDVFNDDSRDIFAEMAVVNGIERDSQKTLTYLMQFGGGAGKAKESLGLDDIAQAKSIINTHFKNNPGMLKAARLAQNRAEQFGYVKYWTGRKRHFQFSSEYRKAFNALCQGGAFEIVKRQGVRLYEAGFHNDECRMDLTVHDSYRFSILRGRSDYYVPQIKALMEDVKTLSPEKLGAVRFKVDAKRWATK